MNLFRWMIFFCFQDDYPLASLPLLGYSVSIPSDSENIHKDYVFKLHFKSHVYYFRSESEYTFERYGCNERPCCDAASWVSEGYMKSFLARRWMEVIRSATLSSSGARGLNNKESRPVWVGSPRLGFLHIRGTFVHVAMHIWCFFLTLYWWHVRWFRLHQRLHFWLFLLSTLKPLSKDVILYSFLMVSATTTISGFTFCHWLYLTAGPCWGPAFCPRWFSFHHIVMTLF